jgi:hypothetical protein
MIFLLLWDPGFYDLDRVTALKSVAFGASDVSMAQTLLE